MFPSEINLEYSLSYIHFERLISHLLFIILLMSLQIYTCCLLPFSVFHVIFLRTSYVSFQIEVFPYVIPFLNLLRTVELVLLIKRVKSWAHTKWPILTSKRFLFNLIISTWALHLKLDSRNFWGVTNSLHLSIFRFYDTMQRISGAHFQIIGWWNLFL